MQLIIDIPDPEHAERFLLLVDKGGTFVPTDDNDTDFIWIGDAVEMSPREFTDRPNQPDRGFAG